MTSPNEDPKRGQLVFSSEFDSIDDVTNNWNQETSGNGDGFAELQ